MVRNAKFAEYAATPRPVVAILNNFPVEHVLPPHHHERAQLVYGATGMMMVETRQGRWVVPPDRAVWIPAGMEHNLGRARTKVPAAASLSGGRNLAAHAQPADGGHRGRAGIRPQGTRRGAD